MPDGSTYHLMQGAPRRVYGARRRVQREAHTLVVANTEGETGQGAPHAMWIKDLRRGRRSIYGSLLLFIDVLRRKGVALETALMIPAWIESYIREVWDSPTSPQSRPVQLMTTGEHKAA